MTAVVVAALLLAAALLARPSPSRYRLAPGALRRGLRGAMPVAAVLLAGTVLLSSLTTALATAVLGAAIAARWRRSARGRRRREEARATAVALDMVVGELRVGAHPVQAFATAAAECDSPVAEMVRTVAARARLGADVASGLHLAAATATVPAYWHRIAVYWQLAADHGLAMAALMRAAHHDIVDRQRFGERIDAALAGARATAAILAGLPVLGVVLGQLTGADPVGFLFGGGVGGWFLVAGVTFVAAGLVWSDRITEARTG